MLIHILQNIEPESPGTIIDWLKSRQIDYKIIHTYKGEPLPHIESVETIINLGSPASMQNYTEFDFLKKVYNFVEQVVNTNKRYLGICFGSQILAQVLGGDVSKNPVKELGRYNVSLTKEGMKDPLFSDFPHLFPVCQWHGDTFSIPEGCTLLVEGSDCQNQAFRHQRQCAVQFHCEVDKTKIEYWCKTYQHELLETDKSADDIIEPFATIEEELKSLNFQLLDNVIKL